MNLQQAIAAVQPPCEDSRAAARRRFSDIAIPLGSLGLLQDTVAQLAAIQRTVRPSIAKRAVVMFCADNGVVAQGVTQCGQEVTATVTENMGRGKSTVCLMAKHIGMDSFPVDIGVARDVEGERILRRKIRYGTADMTKEPAMTREEAVRALETGIQMAEWCAAQGYRLVCGGEMGIGNTTTSSAVLAALLFRRSRPGRKRAPGPLAFSVGRVHERGARPSQQDSFAVSPPELEEERGLLLVLADGIGGLADGDKASQTAVNEMMNGFCTAEGSPEIVLLDLLRRANEAVNGTLGAQREGKSGSTLVAALLRDGWFHWISVGDSRIALLRGGVLHPLNREHVFRRELLLAAINGVGSLEDAMQNPRAAGLTSYLGMGVLRHVDIPAEPVRVLPGDRFVLMSDGVTNALEREELEKLLSLPADQAAEAVRSAVEAKKYAGQDNYTAIILEAEERGKGKQ